MNAKRPRFVNDEITLARNRWPRRRHHRRVASSAIRPTSMIVGPKPHLIAPVNFAAHAERVSAERGIVELQPTTHRNRIPFVGPGHRLLRGQAPLLEIAAHRPHRQLHPEVSAQQEPNGFPGPEGKGQPQLVRTTADDQPDNPGGGGGGHLRARGSAAPLGPQRPDRTRLGQPYPAVDRGPSHLEHSGRLRLRESVSDGLDHPSAQGFLRVWTQRSRVLESPCRRVYHVAIMLSSIYCTY